MKPLLILLFLLAALNYGYAECGFCQLKVYPQRKQINENSIFVLEGSCINILDSLNRKYPIYLKSKRHKVKLEVVATYGGLYGSKQVILKPKKRLIPGRVYAIHLKNVDAYSVNLLKEYNSMSRKKEPVSWKVEDKTDAEAPQWVKEPSFLRSEVWPAGCGDSQYAIFKLKAYDPSEVLIKTELLDQNTNQSYTCYLPVDNTDRIWVGHNMCDGLFSFSPGHTYKVRFKVMDLSGNEGEEWSKWVAMENPYQVMDDSEMVEFDLELLKDKE